MKYQDDTVDYTSYRYERKFVTTLPVPRVLAEYVTRHPAMFMVAYPPRRVSNLYLDTPGLKFYNDHIHGANQRRKVRIRWYSSLWEQVNNPVIEIKERNGGVNVKYAASVLPFSLTGLESKWNPELDDNSRQMCALHGIDAGLLQPALINSYTRHYYVSADGVFRLTVDHGIENFMVQGRIKKLHTGIEGQSTIIELKYNLNDSDNASGISNFFPFRISRNSKYINGINSMLKNNFLVNMV